MNHPGSSNRGSTIVIQCIITPVPPLISFFTQPPSKLQLINPTAGPSHNQCPTLRVGSLSVVTKFCEDGLQSTAKNGTVGWKNTLCIFFIYDGSGGGDGE
ncbi:hypothetical protein BLNAU_8338 [Blattamonas nauphoetae]|uniref:Uncharacterized protein n=1 Tax=Blattamonas nauphoetae TaxID=2049346 RepID=A0ABQ9XZ22_9EUKA|nr:hypothetical protein BLNAU_8338 [Blattamonas nauphoetae]